MSRPPIPFLALLLLILGVWLAPGTASADAGGCPAHAHGADVAPVGTAAGAFPATSCDHGECHGTCGHWVCPLVHAAAAVADTGTRADAVSAAATCVAVTAVALPDVPWAGRAVLRPPPVPHAQDPTQKRRVLRL
jgi:hypothetical protein